MCPSRVSAGTASETQDLDSTNEGTTNEEFRQKPVHLYLEWGVVCVSDPVQGTGRCGWVHPRVYTSVSQRRAPECSGASVASSVGPFPSPVARPNTNLELRGGRDRVRPSSTRGGRTCVPRAGGPSARRCRPSSRWGPRPSRRASTRCHPRVLVVGPRFLSRGVAEDSEGRPAPTRRPLGRSLKGPRRPRAAVCGKRKES